MTLTLFLRGVFQFIFPGAGLFLATWILLDKGYLLTWIPGLPGFYPHIVILGGVLLGWRFHRVRLVYGILLLTGLGWILEVSASPGPEPSIITRQIADMAILLIPLNYFLLAFFRDRGVFSLRGLLFLGLIVVQAGGIRFMQVFRPESLTQFTEFGGFLTQRFPENGVLAGPLILGAGVLVFLLVKYIRYKSDLVSGLFWSLLTVMTGLTVQAVPAEMRVYLASAGLILVISVLELSYRLAYNDELTGLPARRALNKTFLELGNQYAIAMVDIDHFKKFNDKYGHDIGDEVLRMVATRLLGVSRGGRVFRYGGEEFSIVFPSRSKKEVIPALEEIREDIAGAKFTLRGTKRPVKSKKSGKKKKTRSVKSIGKITVSIGVAERTPKLSTCDVVIKAADKALYRAKKGGRNRVCA